ncbi:MAG: SDR family oxidoreductase [Desulfopila sp.]
MIDQKILIVGGSSGIGLAVARHACLLGAHPIIASRNAEKCGSLLAEFCGNPVATHSLDITSPAECARLFEVSGPVDHLVIAVRPDTQPAPFHSVNVGEAQKAFQTKLWGAYQLIQAGREYIRETGSITLTSGIAGEKIYQGASVMSLINSATETLCRILAVELAPLRVNAVSPGFVEPKPDPIQERARQFPAKRLATPDEVASAYLWLMASDYITGTVMKVDGGASLTE